MEVHAVFNGGSQCFVSRGLMHLTLGFVIDESINISDLGRS